MKCYPSAEDWKRYDEDLVTYYVEQLKAGRPDPVADTAAEFAMLTSDVAAFVNTAVEHCQGGDIRNWKGWVS